MNFFKKLAPIGSALLLSSNLMAVCKDTILKMKDPKGGDNAREITSFLNCHGGSFHHPEATTVHMFEWKTVHGERKLCQSTRVCGNAKIWRGGLSIGAVWSMGHSITDFLNNTKLKNNYIKLANATEGGDGGDGGDINGGSVTSTINNSSNKVCVNSSHASVATFGKGGAVSSGDINCYPKNYLSNSEWKEYTDHLESKGYISTSKTDIFSPDINFICQAGPGGDGLGDFTGNTNNTALMDCNEAGVNVNAGNGGAGGAGAPGSFGVDAANTVNTGLSNTAYNQIRLYANWDTTYENIRRYCTEPENEFCY
mgnify:CR=1 FL=1